MKKYNCHYRVVLQDVFTLLKDIRKASNERNEKYQENPSLEFREISDVIKYIEMELKK